MSDPPLIRLTEIEDGGSAKVGGDGAGDPGLTVLRRGDAVYVYVNRCPHLGRFLDRAGTHILCANHGALFRIEDGFCIAGPCVGGRLEAVAVAVRDGAAHGAG